MRARSLAPILLWLGAAAHSFAASGSDPFGYRWYDSLEPECPFRDITTTSFPGQFLYASGDDVSAAIPLGFSFPLYGTSYTQVWISTNGWFTFDVATPVGARDPRV